MIETILIESDEDGWHLILPEANANFRLSQAAAFQLVAESEKVREWVAEADGVRRDYDLFRKTGILPDYIPADGEHEPDQAEALREYADRARKESKERPYPEGPLASRRVDP